ncbi:hypothetical protein IC620_00040 [Hazenella sp. IB182357]|uniref:Lipoprotein n=1 Tax=Polycladospora coralii TaxID=2771432 RepID=A0A926NBX9_9BACL|nr:hypothetical protein [Polycladospora coralii]MBD1370749.1 hypothetical protein [Polycladospora coralii]MBS7529687.1 hypothetical protein [Polycladospora coralii]
MLKQTFVILFLLTALVACNSNVEEKNAASPETTDSTANTESSNTNETKEMEETDANADKPKQPTESQETSTKQSTESEKPSTKEPISLQGMEYDVAPKQYVKGDLSVRYPLVKNMRGHSDIKINFKDKEKKVNQLIEKHALAILAQYDFSSESSYLDIDYKVTWKSGNVISIQYKGTSYSGGAYPINVFYTTNIDIANEKTARLKEFMKFDSALLAKLRSDHFKVEDPAQGNLTLHLSDHDLLTRLQQADTLGSSNPEQVFSSFTPGKFVISFGVPHARGDYMLHKIDYHHLDDHIKYESEMWVDLGPEH